MSKTDFYTQLLEQEATLKNKVEEFKTLLASVRQLKSHYEENDELKNLDFVSSGIGSYDKDWIIKDKVHYALKSLVKGTAEQVAEKLEELDSSYGSEKAARDSTHHLSLLYRDKIIDAVKIGKKYRYYSK